MQRFAGKNVIVTGGSSGIGRALVHAFVDEGARVRSVGRDAERLEQVRASSSAPERVDTAVVDVRVPEETRRMVRDAIETMGRVHVLCNNAGIAYTEPVLDLREENWLETFATNLHGAFFASQVAAKHMVEKGDGAIVNIASTDAFMVESPQAHYNSSKAALVMMTRCFAHELGHLGLRANCVAPGQTITPMLEGDMDSEEFRREYLKKIPMRRPSQPEEQAAVVLFLASDEASYINGQTIIADGGQLTGDWYDVSDAPPVPER